MNIVYLSSKQPMKVPEYGLLKALSVQHGVVWTGEALYAEVEAYHRQTHRDDVHFRPGDYVQAWGLCLSRLLRDSCWDVILCREWFFLQGLVTDIPVIYLKEDGLTPEEGEAERIAMQRSARVVELPEWLRAGEAEALKRLEALLVETCPPTDLFVPAYAINLKEREDRRRHIVAEFAGRPEYEFHLVDACRSVNGRVGLWNSMVRIVRQAREQGEEFVLICEDDHSFARHYSPKLWMHAILEAHRLGADVLAGGIGGFGTALPRGFRLYEVDWFWCTQFIVVYASLFDRILGYDFGEQDTADGVLSAIAPCKMVVYPFVSEQWDAGYSDVTPINQEQPGKIREFFAHANRKFRLLEEILQAKEERYTEHLYKVGSVGTCSKEYLRTSKREERMGP